MSRTSASLELTEPWRRSQTAKWSILIMRWICPLMVSHVVSCNERRVRKLDSFSRSRVWSFLTLSAAFDSLMASAVDFFFSLPFFPPFFLPDLAVASAAAAAAACSSASLSSLRRFSSSHFSVGSKMEPRGGPMSRRMMGMDERCLTVTKAFLVSRSKVLSIPSLYINDLRSTQNKSNVRRLKMSLFSSSSLSSVALPAVAVFTAFLLLLAAALLELAAIACCGAGTKDMHFWRVTLFVFCLYSKNNQTKGVVLLVLIYLFANED
mmetsp:Transcript_20211/g.57376  ORF Transcript_20211/g.57376 Transcript_20211/m.57376 type:complete len:265 (+) Transcript_20211:331-1125(+)